MVFGACFCHWKFDLTSIIFANVVKLVCKLDLELPVTEQSKLANLSLAFRIHTLSLLKNFSIEWTIKVDASATRDIDSHSCSYIQFVLNLKQETVSNGSIIDVKVMTYTIAVDLI